MPKDNFKFTSMLPNWSIIPVEIKPDDYEYFKLIRRYGPSWWLIGCKTVGEEKELGILSEGTSRSEDLTTVKEFIKWAKTEHGSRIVEISAISTSFDILEEIKKLVR